MHGSPYRLDRPTRWLSQKSVERRRRQGLRLDSTDLPVSPGYLERLRARQGVSIIGTSRWNNTVVIHTTDTLLRQQLDSLPFVRLTELVWVSPDSVDWQHPKSEYHNHFNTWDSVRHEYYGCGKEQIESLSLLKPYSFLLIDEDKETICELYLVDDRLIVLDSQSLMQGLDQDLDSFFAQLMNE